MKRGSKYNFKRVYPYICRGCNQIRGTRIYERRIGELCILCTRKKINENQLELGVLEVKSEI